MQCTSCKKNIVSGAPFCGHCGTPVNAATAVAPPAILIGRDAACAFRLKNARTSQRHATLAPQGDGTFLLQDIGSSNGTFVGSPSNKVQSAVVGMDDTIYFADEAVKVSTIVGAKAAPARQQGAAKLLRIGRASDNDIVLDDASVSRHHAILEQKADGTWWIEDCGSSNGTFVNGVKVSQKDILHSDVVHIGKSMLEKRIFQVKQPYDIPKKNVNISHDDMTVFLRIVKSWYFPIVVMTVGCVAALFYLFGKTSAQSILLYREVLAFYICILSGLLIYRFSGSCESLLVLFFVGAFIFYCLESSIFLGIFSDLFRKSLPQVFNINSINQPFLKEFLFSLFRAGLMEEMIKIIPVFIGIAIYYYAPPPWKIRLGVSNEVDAIMFGVAAGIGFTLNETVYNHLQVYYSAILSREIFLTFEISNISKNVINLLGVFLYNTQGTLTNLPANELASLQKLCAQLNISFEQFVNVAAIKHEIFLRDMTMLMIPRTLESLAGHAAFSGCLGYFLAKATLSKQKSIKTFIFGYLLVSVLHALSNTMGENKPIFFVIALCSFTLLIYFIIKARQNAGIPLSIVNFSRRHD